MIVGGSNYGQGSSREHAALVPLYLGVRAVVAKSFARIHAANLINAGILPLTFVNADDYDKVEQDDELVIENAKGSLETGKFELYDVTKNIRIPLAGDFSSRQCGMLLAGGLLPYTKDN